MDCIALVSFTHTRTPPAKTQAVWHRMATNGTHPVTPPANAPGELGGLTPNGNQRHDSKIGGFVKNSVKFSSFQKELKLTG
jgi:hypothetical protein